MKRIVLLLSAAVVLGGCRAPAPAFDPFAAYGPHRIAPPATGTIAPGAPADPYYRRGSQPPVNQLRSLPPYPAPGQSPAFPRPTQSPTGAASTSRQPLSWRPARIPPTRLDDGSLAAENSAAVRGGVVPSGYSAPAVGVGEATPAASIPNSLGATAPNPTSVAQSAETSDRVHSLIRPMPISEAEDASAPPRRAAPRRGGSRP